MCIYLDIYETTFVSFCVFRWNILIFFECFYRFLPCLILVFVKSFPLFYEQMKLKAGKRSHPPTKNKKHIETLQTKQI